MHDAGHQGQHSFRNISFHQGTFFCHTRFCIAYSHPHPCFAFSSYLGAEEQELQVWEEEAPLLALGTQDPEGNQENQWDPKNPVEVPGLHERPLEDYPHVAQCVFVVRELPHGHGVQVAHQTDQSPYHSLHCCLCHVQLAKS